MSGGVVEALNDEAVDPAQGQIVSVTGEGVTVRARFVAMSQRQADREVAAYTLDRLLDLYLVPVTVRRTVDGRDGVLIYWRGPWSSTCRGTSSSGNTGRSTAATSTGRASGAGACSRSR